MQNILGFSRVFLGKTIGFRVFFLGKTHRISENPGGFRGPENGVKGPWMLREWLCGQATGQSFLLFLRVNLVWFFLYVLWFCGVFKDFFQSIGF